MAADPLDQLALRLERPSASLAALKGLDGRQLELLSDAIDATYQRRERQIDADLRRALPRPVVALLRVRSR